MQLAAARNAAKRSDTFVPRYEYHARRPARAQIDNAALTVILEFAKKNEHMTNARSF